MSADIWFPSSYCDFVLSDIEMYGVTPNQYFYLFH